MLNRCSDVIAAKAGASKVSAYRTAVVHPGATGTVILCRECLVSFVHDVERVHGQIHLIVTAEPEIVMQLVFDFVKPQLS